jgi:hypothetical protein
MIERCLASEKGLGWHEQPGDEVLRERCGWDIEGFREGLGVDRV